jgi:hypothetical protein
MHIITRSDIDLLRTPAGGFNEATMAHLPVAWPLQTGWQERLIGRPISDRSWSAAVKSAKAGPKHFHRGNTRRPRP